MDVFASPAHEERLVSGRDFAIRFAHIGLLVGVHVVAVFVAVILRDLTGVAHDHRTTMLAAIAGLGVGSALWGFGRGVLRPDDGIPWILVEIGLASALSPLPFVLMGAVDWTRTGMLTSAGQPVTLPMGAITVLAFWGVVSAVTVVPAALGALPLALITRRLRRAAR